MKNDISSLELYYLIRELKVVEGSKIDRIYHCKNTPKELTVSCHITGEGKKILRIMIPGIIFLDDTKDSSDTQTGLGMMLRKYLEGLRISSIEQKDFERVITITIEGKIGTEEAEKYFLIIELFSKGNIIFCDDEMKILSALEEQTWKDRTIKRGEKYLYPKSRTNILKIEEKEFMEDLKTSDKESLVKALAITFNLGGRYAEEVCVMSGIDKSTKTAVLDDKQYPKLYKNIILLIHEETAANSYQGEIFPFQLESLEKEEKKTYASFNDAIRENYDTIKHIESKKDSNKNVEKIQNIIDEQLKILEECEEGYAQNQAKGELIYEKYQDINKILETVKEARKKYSWKAIKQKIDENPELKKIVKDVDEKTSSIIIELDGN